MKNLSLSQKMWSVISTLIIAFIGSVAFATYHLIEGNKSVDYVGETLLKRIIIASDIKDFQRQLALKVLTMSGTTDKELFEKTKAEYEDLKIKQNENINSFVHDPLLN